MTWKRQKVDDKDALPVAAHRQAVLDALDEHGVLVISGDTGCGKSTQVPQFLLDQDAAHRIVVTQPRRLAARALAERVSAERGSVVGRTVGYAVSRDRVTSLNATRCTFMTVGLLLQLLVFRTKEFFATYSHVIVDEAHERDVDLDLLLLLLRRAMKKQAAAIEAEAAAPPAAAADAADDGAAADAGGADSAGGDAATVGEKRARDDGGEEGAAAAPAPAPAAAKPAAVKSGTKLRLVVMSATIDADAFAKYLGGCSIAEAKARGAAAAAAAEGGAGPSEESAAPVPSPAITVGARMHPVGMYCIEALQSAFAAAGPPTVQIDGEAAGAAAKLHPALFSFVEFLLQQLVAGTLFKQLKPEPPKDVPEGGGVLIFLPGVAEIQECLKALKRAGLANRAAGLTLLPLHSLQDAAEQQAAMARPPPGTRKVILATNIAESSITARRPAAAAAAAPRRPPRAALPFGRRHPSLPPSPHVPCARKMICEGRIEMRGPSRGVTRSRAHDRCVFQPRDTPPASRLTATSFSSLSLPSAMPHPSVSSHPSL